jgi:flagellar export protein FliJ
LPATFTFRFQKLLDLKERREKALEVRLGRLEADLIAARRELEQWERTREATLAQMREARRRGDLRDNARCTAYLGYVRERIGRCHASLEQIASKKEDVRGELNAVMKSRKMLENYRDRLKAEFMAAREKAEERTVEMHTARKYVAAEGSP